MVGSASSHPDRYRPGDIGKPPQKEVEESAISARLHLDPDEFDRMQTELGGILDHFDALAAVDAAAVARMAHAVPSDMPLRADEPQPSLPSAEALRGAPKHDSDLFVVPAIIPGSEP